MRYIIEYGGKFWSGSKFSSKALAKTFRSKSAAWEYIGDTFSDDVSEDFTLWKL